MTLKARPRETLRFGDFTLDVSAYELRRQGRPVRLERRPMDLLVLLIERRGELVTRNEIIDKLWGKDVFVDVETGINTIVWKVRGALRDSKDQPAFVETVAGRGYRFIAVVEVVPATLSDAGLVEQPTPPTLTDPGLAERATPPTLLDPGLAAQVTPSTLADAGLAEQPTPATATAASGPALPAGPIRLSRTLRVAALVAVVLVTATFVIREWLGASRRGTPVTVTVMPFDNLGGDTERQHLADGLAEETTASLGQIDPDHLTVVGRTSIVAYKRLGKSLADIGRELHVDYVVQGGVRVEGNRLHIATRLIRAADETQVWSTSYDRALTNIVGLHRELSTAIAEQVRLQPVPDRVDDLGRRQTQIADAFDAYLRGRYYENRRNRESTSRAIRSYEHAITLDPNYALAWSALAFTYAASAINSDAHPLEVVPRAREAAANAVRVHPNLTESQFAAGYVNWLLDWKWEAAEAALRRAVDLDPSNVTALRTLGHVLSQMGRHTQSEEAMRRTRELDPLSAMSHALSAQIAFQARDNANAVKHARQAILIDSTFWIGYSQLAQAYGQIGETDLALEALADAARFSGGENSKTISQRGYLLARAGRINEAREALRSLAALSRERYLPPYAMALVYAGLGERAAVFEWLDKAHLVRDVHLIFLPVDPKWDPFRADPRFEELIARCGFQSAADGNRVTFGRSVAPESLQQHSTALPETSAAASHSGLRN